MVQISRLVALGLALHQADAHPITEVIQSGAQPEEWTKLNSVLKPYVNQDTPEVGLADTFVQTYYLLSEQTWVENICKTRLYGGHTAMLLLLSNPQAKLYAYDDTTEPYTTDVVNFLKNEFPGRFFFSPSSIQSFETDHPDVKCDLMISGGPHGVNVPPQATVTSDLNIFQKISNPQHHYILADDTDCQTPWCATRNSQWVTAVNEGQVFAQSSVPYFGAAGISIGVFRPYVAPQMDASAASPPQTDASAPSPDGANFLQIQPHS